jgi:hypothetical protein
MFDRKGNFPIWHPEMNMKKNLLIWLFSGLMLPVYADEGMWLPLLLKQLNEPRMQELGLRLSAEDIYSVNRSSMKDAVVQFGRGCTGELVSNQGLLITNHHCGYAQIQQHSSLQKDYLKKGFWAMKKSEELPNPGLTVTFVIRMEDVTAEVQAGLDTISSESRRESLVAARSLQLVQKAVEGTHYEAIVRPMFQGNEYYLFVLEVFRDIRLVGAPPASIGNYGKDTDNWTWPRHTGDFSMFRIYAGKDNKPADYSPENVPFKPRHFFPVNISGLQENDFTMVYGFPGRTSSYLSSYAVEQLVTQSNPLKVDLRAKRLAVMKPAMDANREVFIKYASKYSSVSNYHKKWAGETRGLLKADAIGNKQLQEKIFTERIMQDEKFKNYRDLLPRLKEQYDLLAVHQPEGELMTEGILAVEVLKFANSLREISGMTGADFGAESAGEKRKAWTDQIRAFQKDYHLPIDKRMMQIMLFTYLDRSASKALPDILGTLRIQRDPQVLPVLVDELFTNSFLDDADSLLIWLERADTSLPGKLYQDPLMQIAVFYFDYYRNKPGKEIQTLSNNLVSLNRLYMKALREVFPERKFYPDANFTLRVAYGRAEGYSSGEGKMYPWYTDAEGILEKNAGGNPDYELDSMLSLKIRTRDFGRYAGKDGKLRTCFVASNHTTGGNSGSPVLNGRGELIGLNFDRNWEGTMSDVFYDINQVRNISVDIRYALFLIDKVAGAKHLVQEMKIVR